MAFGLGLGRSVLLFLLARLKGYFYALAPASACLLIFSLFLPVFNQVVWAQESIKQVMVFEGAPTYNLQNIASFIKEKKKAVAFATAATSAGIINSMEVQGLSEDGSYWMALSLYNPSDNVVEGLLIAPYYSLANSGVWSSKVDHQKIINISVNEGIKPERLYDPLGDKFRIIINSKEYVTIIAELASLDMANSKLIARSVNAKERFNDAFYQGAIISLALIVALVLMIVFLVRGSLVFVAASLFSGIVVLYLMIDFGYLATIFRLRPEVVGHFRAATEALLAAGLLAYLFTFLNLTRWYLQLAHIITVWFVGLLGTVALGFFDPSQAMMIARVSMFLIGITGLIVLLILILRGVERAVSFLPSWLLYLLWVGGSAALVMGEADTSIASMALLGGLVLVSLLFGFTVLQQVFVRSADQNILSDIGRRVIALTGGGGIVWDWDVRRDKVFVSFEIERFLGLKSGALNGSLAKWFDHVHSADRDPFQAVLNTCVHKKQGTVFLDFRLRDHRRDYHWYRLTARPFVDGDSVCLRCIGMLTDISDQSLMVERLQRDSLNDSLTNLPNLPLLIDRLQQIICVPETARNQPPFVIMVKFELVGRKIDADRRMLDSLAVPLASRLKRLASPGETLSRVGDLSFAFLSQGLIEPSVVAQKAKAMLDCAADPIEIGGDFYHVTGYGGIALYDAKIEHANEMNINAGLALERAHMLGKGRIETYNQSVRVLVPPKDGRLDKFKGVILEEEFIISTHPVVDLSDNNKVVALKLYPEWQVEGSEVIEYAELTEDDVSIDVLRDVAIKLVHKVFAAVQSKTRKAKSVPLHFSLPANLLESEDIYKEIKHVTSQDAMSAKQVTLLFDEARLARSPEQIIGMMNRYADLGVGLGIHNFCMGFGFLEVFERCSISYVYHKPVMNLDQCDEGKFLSALALFCKTMCANLVIENVNSQVALKSAVKMGFQFGQGAHFDKGTLRYGAQKKRSLAK